jgi:hypothetical protein
MYVRKRTKRKIRDEEVSGVQCVKRIQIQDLYPGMIRLREIMRLQADSELKLAKFAAKECAHMWTRSGRLVRVKSAPTYQLICFT